MECATILDFADWIDFKSNALRRLFGDHEPRRGRFLFRGQRNASWSLASTFDRSFPSLKGKRRSEAEKLLISHFREECEADESLRQLLADNIASLAFAQHCGVPTRLLDWTESPYIAAFFAFQHAVSALQGTIEDYDPRESVAIWALDRESDVWGEDRGVQIVSLPTWDNARMKRQAGHFTLSRTPFRTLQEYVNHFGEEGKGAMTLCRIPGTVAKEALADIELMGISNSSMFPDSAGRAKAAIVKTVLGASPRRSEK